VNLDIGLYIPTLNGGGAQRVALNLAQGFADRSCNVDIIVIDRKGGSIGKVAESANVVDLEAKRTLTSIPKLASHLRSNKYDALISFMNYVNICSVVASLLSQSSHKIIVTEHTTVSRSLLDMGKMEGWGRSKLIQCLYPLADHVIAVSQGAAEDLQRVGYLQNVHAIPNPISVNTSSQTNERGEVPHPWLSEGDPVIMGAGRLIELKGFSTLIRSLRHVRDRGAKARLIIIGEGEERQNLEGLVHDLDLKRCVAFPGFVSDPFTFMRLADVFVLSSRWEGFGNVLVEAMACGTPVVSTDCPNGPREILEGGKWGELVPVENETEMAQAIMNTLNAQTASAHQLKKRAQDFAPETIAERYLDLISGNHSELAK
jgi:glycosyltransferase involved in cell wall biosynthesis